MPEPKDYIHRGARVTGEALLRATEAAGGRFTGGPGVRILSSGRQHAISKRYAGHGRLVSIMVQITGHTSERRMHWRQVIKQETGYEGFVGKQGDDAWSSDGPGNGSPAYILPISAPLIPVGQLARLHRILLADGDRIEYWIEAPGSPEFGALITGNDYGAWPRAYSWEPSRAAGPYEQILPGAPGWEELGEAHNLVEMLPGFGDTVSPYGGQMSDADIEVEVLAIPTGQPVRMWLSSDQFGQPWPRFSAPNALKVTCKNPPAPGAATSGGAATESRDLLSEPARCGGCS